MGADVRTSLLLGLVGVLLALAPARADDNEAERARRARVGERVIARLRNDPRFEEVELHCTWADPYAVVQVGTKFEPGDRQRAVNLLQHLYRTFLTMYGERFELADLMAPWGGRPDLHEDQRRYEEGVPLVVVLYRDEHHFLDLALGGRTVPPVAAGGLSALVARDGAAHVRDTDRLGEAAVSQLLWWFHRQQSVWRRPLLVLDPLVDGFATWFGTHVQGPEPERQRLREMQQRALAFAAGDRPYPVFDVQDLVYALWSKVVVGEAQGAFSVLPSQARAIYSDQTWAFVRMLQEHDGGAHREKLLTYVDGWLSDRSGRLDGWMRAFGVQEQAQWEPVNAIWHAYLAKEVLGPVDVAPPGGRRLLVELMRYGYGDEDGTLVLLTAPDMHRRDRATRRVPIQLPFASFRRERFQHLVSALAAFPRTLDGTHRHVTLVHRHLRSGKARSARVPTADERLIVLALLAAGYDDIALDETISPEVATLLDAWRALDAPAER